MTATGPRSFASCHVDGLLVGIDVDAVQEVTSGHALTTVPLAPAFVGGLLNLRGQIVTAIDLRTRLGLPARPVGARGVHLILRADGGAVSLLVDSVGDVVDAGEDGFETPPATMGAHLHGLITGAYKLEHDLLLILDTECVVGESHVD